MATRTQYSVLTRMLHPFTSDKSDLIVLTLNGNGPAPAEPTPQSCALTPVVPCEPEEQRAAAFSPQSTTLPTLADGLQDRTQSVQLARVSPLVSANDESSYASEQYRLLRTRICQLLKTPFQLVITSPSIGDGKTVTAINLATAMALRSEERTLLVDADLRRSSIHRALNVPIGPGLADVLQGSVRLEDAIFTAKEVPGLHVLTAGMVRGNPTELLDSAGWRNLTKAVREQFAQIIIDCPPVEVVADFDLIAQGCDGVALVLRPDHTGRTLSLNTVAKLKPKLTGVIINAYQEWFLWKKPSHHGYYRYYRPGS